MASETESKRHRSESPEHDTETNSVMSNSPKKVVDKEQARLSHALVEKNRREHISQGFIELGHLLPEPEKSKGLILQAAILYIKQLKEREESNERKWALEKILFERAINELSSQNHAYRAELDSLRKP